ncbi:MAG: ankyrin repeat domain-containing protein [Chlorobi bacterium]|nr:ankyrin repeat domain-containing protein [Chlorobiota bacterium]
MGTYIPIVKHFYNNKYRHYTANSTAFIEAVNMNNINVVKKFVELGADVNKVSKDGEYPLNTAVFHNSKGIFDFLLEKGADISVIDLSRNKDIDFIEYAVKKGADPKTININFALKGGEELKRILALKPDINKFPLDYEVIFKTTFYCYFFLKTD